MKNIVDIIKEDGRWGVVEGKEAVLNKIKEIGKLEAMMKEMAHMPLEEMGKREPGETCMYERKYDETNI